MLSNALKEELIQNGIYEQFSKWYNFSTQYADKKTKEEIEKGNDLGKNQYIEFLHDAQTEYCKLKKEGKI